MLISNFLLPLALTVAAECLVAFVCGFRGKYFFIVLVLANVITNPLLNWIMVVVRILGLPGNDCILVVLEVGAVVVEWRLLAYAFPGGSKRYLLLSIAMNIASYVTGLLVLHG